MKLQSLLAIPFIIGLAACSSPPEIDASSRAEAMNICANENKKALREVAKEKELIIDKPYLFDSGRDDYYDNFTWTFLHSDKFEDVTILKSYCQPNRNSKHEGYWYVVGYIEYLVEPTEADILSGNSEVKQVITSYPTDWKE